MSGGPISAAVRIRVVGEHGLPPITAVLTYDPADPYAVRAVFGGAGMDPVCWLLSRDLLLDGAGGWAGDGDVQVWRRPGADGGTLLLAMSTPDGEAVLEAPLPDVELFLAATTAVVAPGSERVDVDGLIDGLLGSAR